MSTTMQARRRDSRVHTVLIVIACVLGASLLFGVVLSRVFLFQPFSIPSGAMMPTISVGDYVLVSKSAYGYSRYSLPFLQQFSGRIFAAEPKRGDIAVFRLPKDDSIDYIKRVLGLPGERIQMIAGVLHINGQPVPREQAADFVGPDPCSSKAGDVHVKRWRETLPNGVSYETLDCPDNKFYDNTPVYAVPPGHYFMIGDNRQNSADSRALSQVGYVPFDNLIGRAEVIFYSTATSLRWKRL